jgi:hypothetical protein
MNKKQSIVALIILVALIAVVVVAGSLMSKNVEPTPELPTPQPVTEAPEPAALEKERIQEKYYSMELEYPKDAAEKFPEIETYINAIRSDFIALVPKTDDEAQYQGVDEDRAYVLKTDTTTYTSSSTITYKLQTYMFTGGAHGGTFIATFTYTKDGRLIPLTNLLSSSDSLNKLSVAARRYFYDKLGNQSSREEIDIGTEPNEENFSVWYITDKMVVFIFQEYQIGPYVIAIQEFPLSRAEAKTMLSI